MKYIKNLSYKTILSLIKKVYRENYGDDNIEAIEDVLSDVNALFNGRIKGYLKCDTKYHDLLHTLQVIPPFVSIIDGWNKSGNMPPVSREIFDIGIIAVMLHDTGYIKEEGDTEGTGAKYTFVHIKRSADFAEQYLLQKGFQKDFTIGVRNIIMCTGIKVDYEKIVFNSEEERITGYALGTADILGQMSADDYIEKLPSLFQEFEEAYKYEGEQRIHEMGLTTFKSPNDLIINTPKFYKGSVMERFRNMGSMYKYIPYHFKDSRNYYIEAIEKNIQKIKFLYNQKHTCPKQIHTGGCMPRKHT